MPKDHVVLVGTRINTEHKDYPDSAGLHVWGPFTESQANSLRDSIELIFNDVPAKKFVYGVPILEVRKLRVNEHPFYETAAVAAGNWYLQDD